MSAILKSEDSKKWINAFVAIVSVVIVIISRSFVGQLGEWFDLESKIAHFFAIRDILSVLIGVTTFIVVLKHKKAHEYLQEVYGELVKVIWPDKDSIVKLTIGIIIGVSIVSGILVLIDFIFRKLLGLIY